MLRILLSLLLFVGTTANAVESASELTCRGALRRPHLEYYLKDTLSGLEKMRGANGLVKDTVWIKTAADGKRKIRNLNVNTSPTNIAIDLLIQTELLSRKLDSSRALRTLDRVLLTLSNLRRHKDTGLFFSWYSTGKSSAVAGPNVSAIDNLHLAIGLWTIAETFPGTSLSIEARKLLDPMDFSVFYDTQSGLIGGNLSFIDNNWVRDSYNFSNLGSEARILYSAGWALGLFKKYSSNRNFLKKAFQSLKVEVLSTAQGPLMKLWDGSAFQLFFPKMFINEEVDSIALKEMFVASGNFMIAEGQRRNLPVPAAHSPGAFKIVVEGRNKAHSIYNDKAGNISLVSSDNQDVQDPNTAQRWDRTFTPYALFMAATANPTKLLEIFANIENLKNGNDSLFVTGFGWMDGLHVAPDSEVEVVPALLAVNQGMIALALLQMQAKDSLGASGRAMHNNPITKSRLQTFYKMFDENLKRISNKK